MTKKRLSKESSTTAMLLRNRKHVDLTTLGGPPIIFAGFFFAKPPTMKAVSSKLQVLRTHLSSRLIPSPWARTPTGPTGRKTLNTHQREPRGSSAVTWCAAWLTKEFSPAPLLEVLGSRGRMSTTLAPVQDEEALLHAVCSDSAGRRRSPKRIKAKLKTYSRVETP